MDAAIGINMAAGEKTTTEMNTNQSVEKIIYRCEDTVDGIFTMIYDAWAARIPDERLSLQVEREDTYELFAQYVYVETDLEKAVKVSRSVSRKISPLAFQYIYAAALSFEEDKAMAIYRFLKLGFAVGGRVTDMHARKEVLRIFELHRNVNNEAHLFREFVRFADLENGMLMAKIRPKNQVLPLIADHFADRFGSENFVIIDEKHDMGLFHALGKEWFLAPVDNEAVEQLWGKERSDEYERLWKTFFKSIEIQPRHNPTCQRNHCSLRYRDYMVEFQN